MTITAPPAGFGYPDLRPLMSEMTGDEKHSFAATSTLDVLWVLYDQVLSVDPRRLDDPDRDRFLLSKGHGPMAFYSVLAAKGFLDPAELSHFGEFDSRLADRFAREGWAAHTVDGRDHAALHQALTDTHPDRPLAVVAEVETEELS
ncbi:hypothetical protein [Saccharopolyspora hattusasensis]|uniref:hypothetical protein n=1 Tax=Saccharopolyspora hattusasensis TaxID=1128679 RepID=UPI003D999CDB